jgi:PAS domain S-box-containing protein
MKAVTREERRGAYPPVLVFCLLAAGIFTSAIGLLALLGWVLNLPLLASFGAGLNPMAPSTAVLFLLYGAAICLRACLPLSLRAFRIGLAVVCLGALVALLLFTLGCLNIHLDVEHPGLNIIDVAGKAPLGHMSPVTAFGFLLASLSFLASLSTSATRPWRSVLALGAAGLLVGTSFIFLLAYIYGAPLLYGGTFLPPALNSVLTFVILGLALLALGGRTAGLFGGLPGDGSKEVFSLALIFVLLAAGIVTVGYRYYRNYERQFRADAERELSAIADLKVDELAQYRKERLLDAGAFFKNDAFSVLVRRFLEHPEDGEAQPQIEEWVVKYMATDQYDLICLFDAQGVIRLSVPAEPPISTFVLQNIPEILRSGHVTLQDFHRNEHDQRVYMALLVPIFDVTDHSQSLGVLALRIDPETYLYPFIQRWPTPSRSGETLLVRREGNDALFLNDLKFGTNTALNLRSSLKNTNAPAVKAVLGQTGNVEGVDYRGMPVLATLLAIPDSPWSLVAKMDTAEVYAPLRERLRLTIVLMGLLLVSASLGIGAIWRHQRVRYYKERYQIAEALRESEERFRRVFEEGPTGMALLNETFHFIRVNPVFAAMLGYSEAELQKMAFTDVTHPDHVQQDVEQVRRLLRGELAVYRAEKRYVARSGKEIWGQVQVTVVRNTDGIFRYFLAIVGDITARKRVEEGLQRSEAKFRTLYDSTGDAVMLLDEKGFFDCNPASLAMFGCATREEFCSKHPADVSPPVQPDGSDSRTLANQRIATAREKGTNHFEWMHKRADTGEIFTADVLLSAMELEGKPVLQAVVRDITARKRAEEAVRASETRYRRLFEAARDGILILDAVTGKVVDANPFLTEILGYSHKEFLGKTVWELGFFKDIVANQARFEELQKQEYIRYEDLPLKTSDGRQIHVEFVSNVYQVNQRKVIQCNIRDMTARKQAEESLRYEQTLMGTLMDNLPDAIYFKDAASRFLRTNRALSRKFGLSDPGQIVGKSDTDFFTRDHSRQALADEQEIIRTGQPLLNVEEKETWMDGTVSWVLTSKLPLRDGTGRIIGTCGISRDITERKRVEEALRESRALYHSLVQQLPVGVFRKDREGRYVLVNPHFCWLKGMKAEDFLGKSPREVAAVEAAKQGEMGLATKYAATGVEHHEQILRTGKPIDLVEEYVRADGTKLFLHVVKLPVLDPDGKIIGTQGIQFDITDIKQAEETITHERQLLRTLIDLLPETFYIKDLDSRFLVANEALAKQWGRANPSQLLGLSDADLFPAGQAAQYCDEDRKVFAGEPLMGREGVCVFADGREHTVLTTKVPYRDVQGRICGLVGFGYDITDRKRAEEEIARTAKEWQTTFDATKDAIWILDQNHRVLRSNKTAETYFKRTCCEMLGKPCWEIVHGTTEPVPECPFVRARKSGHRETMDLQQDDRWLEVTVDPILDAAGQYAGAVHIVSDITERKRAADELRAKEGEYRQLFDASPDGVILIGPDGRIVRANIAMARMYRYDSPDDLIGFYPPNFVAPSSREYSEQVLWRRLNGEDIKRVVEYELVRKDGTTFYGETLATLLRNEDGTVAGYICITRDTTERKRAEMALKESEARYQRISEAITDYIYIVRVADGRAAETTHGPGCLAVTGYDMNEFANDPFLWLRMVAAEDRSKVEEQARRILAGEDPPPIEHRIIRKNGTERWVRNTFVPHRDERGVLVSYDGLIQDITGRKRAEQALLAFSSRQEALLAAVPDIIMEVDNHKVYTWANQAGIAFFGKDVVGKEAAFFFEGEQTTYPLVEPLFEGHQETVYVESWQRRKDGEKRLLAWRCRVLKDENGNVTGALSSAEDITERKRAEQALLASEAELSSILESTGDGILAVDRSGERVIKANRRYAEMWRIPQSIIDAGDNNALRNFVLNQLADPDAFLKRVQSLYGTDAAAMDTLVFKDGRVFERHGFPMMMAGAVLGRVWSFRDITERKRQERELAEKNLELERFTYTVSHDLKSPLVTVKTFLGYLEQDLLNPDAERVKQDVGYMRGAADKMGHLLDELLNLARVGRKTNPPVRVTFQQVAREAIGLVAGRISTSRAEVKVADATVILEGDRPRLVEIWQNLVENACKFMGDQPKPRVEIGVEQRGAETVFFVRDNGTGIDSRYHEKVFSLFEKLNPKIEGTGMGLALVKRVVELYKGRIWVESGGLGQGANFLFTLPGAVIIEAGQSS